MHLLGVDHHPTGIEFHAVNGENRSNGQRGCSISPESETHGALECNVDYVYLNNTLPKTLVSGSPLAYGPVGVSPCSDHHLLTVTDTEVFYHNIKYGGAPDWRAEPVDLSGG
eukprot:SAG31_NODE_6941_length_1842_cov_2.096959_2_plen_111_part_01